MTGKKLFIVEDEGIVAEDLGRMLERSGYQIVGSVRSGDEAIKKVEATKPDLVLMDINIRGSLDGIEVAKHILMHLGTPVIYLTAFAGKATMDRAKETSPAGYIFKPFDERDLRTTIESALDRH